MKIVQVQFQSKHNKDLFAGREYSYYAAIPLKLDDIVAVPTKHGTGVAKVTKVNVSPDDVGCDIRLLKSVESLAEEKAPKESQPTINDTATSVPAPTF